MTANKAEDGLAPVHRIRCTGQTHRDQAPTPSRTRDTQQPKHVVSIVRFILLMRIASKFIHHRPPRLKFNQAELDCTAIVL